MLQTGCRAVSRRLAITGYKSVTTSYHHDHELAGGEVRRERRDLLTALGHDRVGNREEIAPFAQTLAHAGGVEIRGVLEDDGVYSGPKLIGGLAENLDWIVGGKLQRAR